MFQFVPFVFNVAYERNGWFKESFVDELCAFV